MTVSTPARSHDEQPLEGLRTRYEHQGFTFQTAPGPLDLPEFFGSYIPDAIAHKPGLNVAIEVKSQNTSTTQDFLQRLRKLFDDRPGWRFDVVFLGGDREQRVAIPPASPARLRVRVDEVRKMANHGQNRAAFVMAWSLLEAALNSKEPRTDKRPHTPGTVLQSLAMNGYIAPQVEQRMRSLIDLRNRIVHGDVEVEPSSDDVQLVLSAISETLEADAA